MQNWGIRAMSEKHFIAYGMDGNITELECYETPQECKQYLQLYGDIERFARVCVGVRVGWVFRETRMEVVCGATRYQSGSMWRFQGQYIFLEKRITDMRKMLDGNNDGIVRVERVRPVDKKEWSCLRVVRADENQNRYRRYLVSAWARFWDGVIADWERSK